MIYEFYSSRRFPRHLKEALRLLALARGEYQWQVHNRAVARGMKQLWQETGLGEWPGRAALEVGKVQVRVKEPDPETGILSPEPEASA